MKLVIVESPTKAKTISKFLGKGYKIESCFGHIRDLPKSKIGVDIENDFDPAYEVPEKAKKAVSNLKKLAKTADTIILASDEDREGEAIAWHLIQALGLKNSNNQKPSSKNKLPKIERIVFHEITKDAILRALENPREINQDLVDAQQARRVLDRLVGYELSPFLWKKVTYGLSAGRVQSVATRLIVEREEEIKAFKIDEYWSILARLKSKVKSRKLDVEFESTLRKIDGKVLKKLNIKNEKEAKEIVADLEKSDFIVVNIEKKKSKKSPPKPFTTSTLQQTANRLLGFSAKRTMMLAQRLYEGVETKSEGQVGLITYMRTDSLNLSNTFLIGAKEYLRDNLGKEYALDKPRVFKAKTKGAQEAHEAIRPTDPARAPKSLKNSLDPAQYKLYQLIWQRALASQMPEALADNTTIDIDAADKKKQAKYQLRSTGQVLKFPGYLKIYPEKSQDLILPELKEKENLDLVKIEPLQHFTKPPARYSDATLVKELEKHGIGRPSTYAPTIATIIARNYVTRDDDKRLAPTDIAFVVNKLLTKHFNDIIDYEFTAKIEEDFDKIAHGKIKWQPMIGDFYNPFHKNLKTKEKQVNKKDIMPEVETDETCDKCKSKMLIKTGRFGKFLACSGYPDCKNTKQIPGTDRDKDGKDDNKEKEELEKKYKNETCGKCGAEMTIRVGKFGPFLGCSAFPKCKGIKNIKESKNATGVACPKCEKGEIVQKRSRRGIFYACDAYPDCKNAYWAKPTGAKCKNCESLILEGKDGKDKCGNRECND